MLIFLHSTFQLLNQCKTLAQLQQVHAQALAQGLLHLQSSPILTKILFSCAFLRIPLPSSLNYALSLFLHIRNRSTFDFNNLMRIHMFHSSSLDALKLFAEMRSQSVSPDSHTFPFALKASAQSGLPSVGRSLHAQALKLGFIADIFVKNTLINLYSYIASTAEAHQVFDEGLNRDIVSCNALLSGYVKAGDLHMARKVFEAMSVRDEFSWVTLLAGYAQMNQCKEALHLFDELLSSGAALNSVAVVGALSACAQMGALEEGKLIQSHIRSSGIRLNAHLVTALVDMYTKCGCIEAAMEVFESSPEKNVFTWNAMITGCAMHGRGELAFAYFQRMNESGIQPDEVTFLGVLMGCSHSGLLESARKVFDEMQKIHGLHPGLSHYGCMVDLLSRAGLVGEALTMVQRMPMEGDVYVWGGLLGGCRMHGNVEIAEIAAGHLMSLNPEDGGAYSVMANIYAGARRWEDVARVRALMRKRKVKRNAGCSLIRVDAVTHEFVAGERMHPSSDEVRWVLGGIFKHLSEECEDGDESFLGFFI